MEIKAIESVVADVTDRTVTGFASVYGVVDSVRDIVHPGSFAKTLRENGSRVRHLWMHDPMQPPIATIKEMREVGRADLPKELTDRYPEATGGLLVKREYLPTPRAEEILAAIRASAITEMSFGYDAIKYDYGDVKSGDRSVKVRNLRENRLWDTSDVTFGANPATQNVKTLDALRRAILNPDPDKPAALHLYELALAELSGRDLTAKSRETDMWLVIAATAHGILTKDYPQLLGESGVPAAEAQAAAVGSTSPEALAAEAVKGVLTSPQETLAKLTELLPTAEPPQETPEVAAIDAAAPSASAKALTARKAMIQRALTEAALSQHL